MNAPILTVLAGSHAHGINTEKSDYDYLSIRVAPPESVIGIAPPPRTVTQRDAPQGARSKSGDVEHTCYELRHYMQLAAQGNPNILVPLFASEQHITHITEMGESLRALAPSIVSMQAVRRHLGYLDAQRGRMIGAGPHQSRKPSRPELVELHGYDTKYAAHALRLAWQGVELARSGTLTLPMRLPAREMLQSIRAGGFTEAKVLEEIDSARAALVELVEGRVGSVLPASPDYQAINGWLTKWQLRYWFAPTTEDHQ